MMARFRRSVEDKDQGFTLIELLVVMIIIGILAAIAVPVFLNQRTKAVDSSIKSDLRTVATNIETVAVDTQAYPTAITASTGGTSNTITVATGQTVTLSTGNVVAYSLTTDSKGFCLVGTNAKSNATAAATAGYWYVSTDGGLKSAVSAKPSLCA